MTARTMYDQQHDAALARQMPRHDDGENLPHPSLEAIETALAVRNQGLKLLAAARLIEAYAAAEAARIRLDCVAAGATP